MTKISLFTAFLAENKIPFVCDVPLKDKCTFRIGGPADLVISPQTAEDITAAIRFARENHIPIMPLGRGSNVMFADEGYRGAILHLGKNFAKVCEKEDDILVCESGARLADVCEEACRLGLAGLEFAFGIPGSIGGAVYMNAGAYGGEMKDVVTSVTHLEEDGTITTIAGADAQFAYRHSIYCGSGKVILQVTLALSPGDKSEIREKMDDIMARRRDKQPLELPSAGSTFKRPEGAYASALIDQCGLKGRSVGGAQVSEKHAGFVVNKGGATAADVMELIRIVQEEVKAKTGFALESEVRVLDSEGSIDGFYYRNGNVGSGQDPGD